MAIEANRPNRWVILGTGVIAAKFAAGFAVLDDAALVAVGSRSAATAEVMRCLRAGLHESPILPLDETLALIQNLDAIRAPWGLRYPGE